MLGVAGGLTKTAKNLTPCETGRWSGSAGLIIVSPNELQRLFNNNKTVKSKFLKVYCPFPGELESILNFIRVPQFKSLDTIQSPPHYHRILATATDGSGHTFEFSQSIAGEE